ncbi:MAG TPA: hypothetical protein VEF76_02375 [Patescibacteria group bacterium]|nr:hypothetical protein [Patescibacteria group bacterium]
MKFEDTKLLRHPTVEKAYNVMRTFFTDGDDWAREAVRAGEIITANAKNPDPDAIAASVLMNGMVIPYEAEQFEQSVSPRAADYLKKFYALDLENPKFSTAGEQQVLLATSVIGLEAIQAKIAAGEVAHVIEYRNVSRVIDMNERSLAEIARDGTTEPEMLQAAQTALASAQNALANVVAQRVNELKFENTGLPDHPTIRGVYEEMKAWAFDGDPLGGYAQTNAAIARVVAESVTSDPEVIGAALLNQYSTLRPGHKKPEDFGPRIGELWQQTSPWARLGPDGADNAPTTPEAVNLRAAAGLYFLESQIESMKTYPPEGEHDARRLEQLEDQRNKIASAANLQDKGPLKTRLENAVAAADLLMKKPENLKIRKPGSPRLDWD